MRHTYGSAPRGSNLGGRGSAGPRPRSGVAAPPRAYARRWPRRGGQSPAAGAGPTARREVESHLHFPFLAHRAKVRDHPRTPRHKERLFSLTVRSKFIGLSRPSGPLGFVVHPSRPPRQGHEPEEPRNYNPHNDPRLAHSLRDGRRPGASAGERVWLPPWAPHCLLCRSLQSLWDSLPRCRGSADCWWCGPGGVGVEPWPPPLPPGPLVHDVREEAVVRRAVAMTAMAAGSVGEGGSESARGRSLGTQPSCGDCGEGGGAGVSVRGRKTVTLRRTGDQLRSGAA